MNGKQARMFRHMHASKAEIAHWRTLTKDQKGFLRFVYENNPKMIWMSYPQALLAAS